MIKKFDIKNKAQVGEFFKILLIVVLVLVLGAGLYFLLKKLTG